MQRIFKPRSPTGNAGFWFAAISMALSFGLGSMLVIGLMNNNKTPTADQTFNLAGALVVIVVAGLLLALSVAIIYRLMKNQPKQVVIEEDRLLVLDARVRPSRPEAEIPFSDLTLVRVADIPVEGGLFPASFEGLLFRWQGSSPEATSEEEPPINEYQLSSRNVSNFEELRQLIFARTPETARGARTYKL